MVQRDQSRGRVLILVQNLPVPLDRRVWLQCRSLHAAGYQVSVVCPKEPDDPAYERLEGIHLHKYAPPPRSRGVVGFAWEVVYCWVQTLRLTLRVMRGEGFDVIQACNPPDTFWALAVLLRPFGKRFVYDQHDLCPELFRVRFPDGPPLLHRLLLLLERATYAVADHVIATNGSFRTVALDRGGRAATDVTVVRSGPIAGTMRRGDPRPHLRRGKRHLLCYLGVMGPQDGVDRLLRAVAHLVHELGRRDVHVALLGFGDSLDDLRRLTVELGIGDHVEFTGRADDAMIADYLSTADLAVAPDPKNDFNDRCTMNKVVEYLAFELPVVSFDLIETRVTAGEAAVYVDGDDPVRMAIAIDGVLRDPLARRRMGRVGRERVVQQLSWEHQATRYVGVFDRLLGHGQSPLEPAARASHGDARPSSSPIATRETA